MTSGNLDAWLARSFEDRKLSRSERQDLVEVANAAGSEAARLAIVRLAFAIARQGLAAPEGGPVLGWLEEVVVALRERAEPSAGARMEAHFSPGEDCPRAIQQLLDRARRSIDACVFTITDDRLAAALIGAHRRGVAVRVVTDDAKAEDLGSDAGRLEREGIAVRVDRSPFHMHHKFAIVDGSTLLTGSYNWTRGAANDNEENLIVVADPRLLTPFAATFELLWDRFG
jgi:cardiolipin hydrolase